MKDWRILVLTPPQHRPEPQLAEMADRWRHADVSLPLQEWQAALPECQIVRVDGQRHDLWWEFALKHSFRWQAHLHQIPADYYRRRVHRLAFRFGLTELLEERVEDLTPAECARADLAVALLPHPDLLIWEEPFAAIPREERPQVVRAVQTMMLTEGLVVVAASRRPDGLEGMASADWEGLRALS